jgi:hypothetical protein
MSYTVKQEQDLLRVVFSGTFQNHDLRAGGEELDRIEQTAAVVPHRLSDLRPVERLEIDFAGVLDLAMKRRRLQFKNDFKSAIIVNDVARYGFARMYQILNDHSQICIAIFGDEESALGWLRAPGHAPPAEEWMPAGHESYRG